MSKADIYFAEDGKLSKVFDGYEVREEQLELSRKIHEAIEEQKPMLGEANTGVGKSLAALTGAATIIEETNRPVVIVTSSILLQEQYIQKDIPILKEATGYEYSETVAKGKGNYLCLEKLLTNRSKFEMDEKEDMETIQKWSATTETGDFSELDFDLSYNMKKKVSIVEQNECKGKTCPLYHECFYYKNQRKIQSSKIIVCNYHYFFLALEIPNMLPDGIGAVIFDEFHEVINIARDILEVKSRVNDFETMNSMLARTQRAIQNKGNEEGVDLEFAKHVHLEDFMSAKTEFHYEVTKWMMLNRDPNKERLVITGELSESFGELLGSYYGNLSSLLEAINYWLNELRGVDEVRLFNDGYEEDHTEWYVSVMKYRDFVEGKYDDLELIHKTLLVSEENRKRLIWLEQTPNNSYADIVSKPFDVTELLGSVMTTKTENQKKMIEGAIPIGMSATLTAGGRFDHFKEQIGLKEDTVECIVNSPFDMTNNMLWYLPKDAPDGNQPGHNIFVLNEMSSFIDELKGRTMCLFTSVRSMNEAARHFESLYKGTDIKVMKQGDYTRKYIVETMRENENVVVVATRSFFTGVDIQGDNLRAVLIDKLPFPMIGDPINEYLMSQPRGFFKYSLPETIITLKQGFGRLIRTANDQGVVSVLDGRLRTKGYRNRIFNSFSFKLNGTTDKEKAITFAKGE